MTKVLDLNWKEWLYALGWATIGGAANGLVASLVVSDLMTRAGWEAAGKIALASMAVSLFLYLKQRPLPTAEDLPEPQAPPAPPATDPRAWKPPQG